MAGQIDCSFEEIVPGCKIPGDVMVSILTNLPVKSLLKFKAVSKPWCSFISSPAFVKLHLRRQSVVANNLLFSSAEGIYGLLPHNHEKNNTCIDSDVLNLKSCPISSMGYKLNYVIDSCNGLVCLYRVNHHRLILCNPATRICRWIRLHLVFDRSFHSLGLCYIEATNDFKIVGWAKVGRFWCPSLFVYTLSSDSWKECDWDCDHPQLSPIAFGRPTFIRGCMHWLSTTSSSKNVITVFDATNEAMSFFGVPDDSGESDHGFEPSKRTLAIRGFLSIVCFRNFDYRESGLEVWVMEEYGVEESWVKRFTIQDQEYSKLVMRPLTSWNEGEIVVSTTSEGSKILIFFDLFNDKKYFLDFKSFHAVQVFSYVESLVSFGTRLKKNSHHEIWNYVVERLAPVEPDYTFWIWSY